MQNKFLGWIVENGVINFGFGFIIITKQRDEVRMRCMWLDI